MDESQQKVTDNLRRAIATTNMDLFRQMMEFASLVFSNAEKRQYLVFYGVHFRGKLGGQDFSGVDFSYCTFYACDFSGLDFNGANFEGAEFNARGHLDGVSITRRKALEMNPIGWEEHREKYIDLDDDAEALDHEAQGTRGRIAASSFNHANMKNFILDGWNPLSKDSPSRMWIGWSQFGAFAVESCSFRGVDFTGSLFRTVGFNSCDFTGAQMDINISPEWGDKNSNKTYIPTFSGYPKLSWAMCNFQRAKIDWSKGPESGFAKGFYVPAIAACDFTGASIVEIAPSLNFKFKDCDFSRLGPSPGVTLWNQLKPPLKSVKLKLWKGGIPGNIDEVLYIATDELVDNLDDLKDSIVYDMNDRSFGGNHDLLLHSDEDNAVNSDIGVGSGAYIYAVGAKKTAKEIHIDTSGSANQTTFPYLYSDSLPSDKPMHPFIIEISSTKAYGVGYEPHYEREMLVKGFIYDEDYAQGSVFVENIPEGGKIQSWKESPDAQAQWRDASMEGFLAFLANDPDKQLWMQSERGRDILAEMVDTTWDEDEVEADIMRELGLISEGTSPQLDLFSSPDEKWEIFYDDPAPLWVAENIFNMDQSEFEDWQDDPKNPMQHVFDAAVVAWAKDLTQEIKAGLKAVHKDMEEYDNLKPVDFDEIAYYLHINEGYDIVSIGDYTDGWGDRTLVFSDDHSDFSNSLQFLGLSSVNY